jgi:hypothetical protein
MKKNLLIFSIAWWTASVCQAQIFSQNFNSSSVLADYVNAAGEANKFTAISTSTNSNASITGGQLVVNKTLSTANLATISYGGANANLSSNLLKVKFTFTVNGSPDAGAGYTFIVGNTGVGTNNTVTTAPNGAHSRFQLNFTGQPGEVTFKPVGSGSDSAPFSGPVEITFVVNNRETGISYIAPDGSSEGLGKDKWDLWVGTTKVFNEISADGPENNLINFKLVTVSSAIKSNVSFDNFLITNENDTQTLPISLSYFTAKASLQAVDLTWSTTSEQKNDRFEVFRSGDGKNFSKIGEVKGAGTSIETLNYYFKDKYALPGTSYYKLTQVDLNGERNSSETIGIKSNVKASYFSVATGNDIDAVKVSIFSANEGRGSLSIYDLNGKKIISQAVNLNKGYSNYNLPFSAASGLYIASLTTGNETIKQKFIK